MVESSFGLPRYGPTHFSPGNSFLPATSAYSNAGGSNSYNMPSVAHDLPSRVNCSFVSGKAFIEVSVVP